MLEKHIADQKLKEILCIFGAVSGRVAEEDVVFCFF